MDFELEIDPNAPLPLLEFGTTDGGSNPNKPIKLNVGGQVFQTSLATLTKYPESAIAIAFNQNGIPKTEEGHFFLDVNPDHFKIVLDWLRYGEITTNDPELLKATMNAAYGLGLKELMEELKKIIPKQNSYPSLIRLCFRPETPIIGNRSHEVMTDLGLGTYTLKGL